MEALNTLYGGGTFPEDEFLAIVSPMFTGSMVELLGKLHQWSIVDPYNVEDDKYRFAKQLSEVRIFLHDMSQLTSPQLLSNLANLTEQKFHVSPPSMEEFGNLFGIYLSMAQSPSLTISISALAGCSRFLRIASIAKSPAMTPLMGPLLELCSARLVRYESMPADCGDPSLMLLLEDIDTMPERHAFLGNYRKICSLVIETMIRQKSPEALYYIFNQIDHALDHLYDGQPPFTRESLPKVPPAS